MITMNYRARINCLERLFSRSCLESSPADVEPKLFSFSAAPRSRGRTHSQLHQLKRKLLRAALEETPEAGLFKRLCGAANQAAELAWTTPCPLLVFPCLFEELAQVVRERFQPEQVWQADVQPWLTPGDVDPDSEGAYPVSTQSRPISVAGLLPVLSIPSET
jgi:hypothetical protein